MMWRDGTRWGTAAEIAAALNPDIIEVEEPADSTCH